MLILEEDVEILVKDFEHAGFRPPDSIRAVQPLSKSKCFLLLALFLSHAIERTDQPQAMGMQAPKNCWTLRPSAVVWKLGL